MPAPTRHCGGVVQPAHLISSRFVAGEAFIFQSDHATALARSSARRIARTASLSFAPPVVPRGLYRLSVTWEKTQLTYGGGRASSSSSSSCFIIDPHSLPSSLELPGGNPSTTALHCRMSSSNLAPSRITSTRPPGASSSSSS